VGYRKEYHSEYCALKREPKRLIRIKVDKQIAGLIYDQTVRNKRYRDRFRIVRAQNSAVFSLIDSDNIIVKNQKEMFDLNFEFSA